MRQINSIFFGKIFRISIISIFSIFIYSCSGLDLQRQDKTQKEEYIDAKYGEDSLLNSTDTLTSGFGLFGSKGAKVEIPILYSVALEKLSFMPLDSMDSETGVITTDWYDIANVENERVKFVVYVLDDQLNSNSLDIKMFKQKFNGSIWKSASVDNELVSKMKSSILKEAQRMATAASQS